LRDHAGRSRWSLLTGRSAELRSSGSLDNMASRETVFLLNNLLLTAFTFTVLLGTLFPILAEAVRGVKVSVGAPFFNRMTIPLCVALLLLVGIGPMLPWRVANMDEFKRKLIKPGDRGCARPGPSTLVLGMRDFWGCSPSRSPRSASVSNLQEFALGHGGAPARWRRQLARLALGHDEREPEAGTADTRLTWA
jgi:cytochrome c-type biogenesis protein CcmF